MTEVDGMGKFHKAIELQGSGTFLLAVNIVGHGAPTEHTEAEPGMIYMDVDSENGDLYKCLKVTITEHGSIYLWKKLVESQELEILQKEIATKANKTGWTANKYLGTDADGNMVEKEAPQTGTGGITKETDPTVPAWAKEPEKPTYTASEVGALPASTEIPANTSDLNNDSGYITIAVATLLNYYLKTEVYAKAETYSQTEVDNLISGFDKRLNAIADSEDVDLDQFSELVAYIKANKSLIDSITTSKVNVSDIVDNLTTGDSKKPLSAAQGKALKALYDAIPAWAKASSKPSYSKSDVGLGNVDNVKQYSASNPPPYPVKSVNGKTGAVTLGAADVGAATTAQFERLSEEIADLQKDRKSITRNVNFVGMSIWWYDGNTLADGFGGGVVCRGYQTLLSEYFNFANKQNYCYSGFSLGATSESDTSSIMVSKSGAWTGTDGDIWTLDTITNDFKRNIPIGEITDYINATGVTTYYGALRAFADKVTELSGSDAIVICSNALRRKNSGYTSTSENTQGHTLLDYEYAIMNVAVRNNWYFIDQYRLSGITDDTIGLTTLDGLHLNNFGYTLAVKPWIEQFGIISAKLLGEHGSAETPDIDDFDITGETITGSVIDSAGAITSASPSWVSTDYIEVSEGEDYAYYGLASIETTQYALVYGYNAAKEAVLPIVAMIKGAARVDSTEDGMIFTVPDGVKYIRACSMVTEAFAVKKLDVTGFVDMAYPVVNYYLTAAGALTSAGNWRTSARIVVDPDSVYKYYGNTSANNTIPCVCGYDSTGEFVSVLLASGNHTDGKEFTVPDGITYIRYCSVASVDVVGVYKSV